MPRLRSYPGAVSKVDVAATPPRSSNKMIFASKVCPNNQFLALGLYDGSVFIYDLPECKLNKMYRNIHKLPVTSLAFSSHSGILASSSEDQTIR